MTPRIDGETTPNDSTLGAKPYPTELHTLKPVVLKVGQQGVTFRRGTKWADVPVGHTFFLTVGSEHTLVGHGRVVQTSRCQFQDIPDSAIQMNHTGTYSYDGIHQAMLRAYGPEFSVTEEVVLIQYERTAATPEARYEEQLRDAFTGLNRGTYLSLYGTALHPLQDAVDYAIDKGWLVQAGASSIAHEERYRLTALGQAHFKVGAWLA